MLFIELLVDRISRNKPINRGCFDLSKATDTANGLGLSLVVLELILCEKWRNKYCVISDCQVSVGTQVFVSEQNTVKLLQTYPPLALSSPRLRSNILALDLGSWKSCKTFDCWSGVPLISENVSLWAVKASATFLVRSGNCTKMRALSLFGRDLLLG